MSAEDLGKGRPLSGQKHSQKTCPYLHSMSRSLDTNPTPNNFWRTPSSPQTSWNCFGFSTRTWSQQTLDPQRTIEELYLEQTYLLDSLHAQSQSATQLTHKIPHLESKLRQPNLRPLHRKFRKQLGWVKSRLRQCMLQEQTISSRLDQLSSEIQTRERWTLAEQEHQLQEMYRHDHALGYQQGLREGLHMRTPWDPEQPAFQPQGYFPQISWPQWQLEQSPDATDERSSCPSEFLEIRSGEVSPRGSLRQEYAVVKYNSHRPELLRRSASMDNVNPGSLTTNTLFVKNSAPRRHSFSSAHGFSAIWTQAAKEQVDADAEDDVRIEELG
ncbi:hypothetical protein BKA65DRAFT_178471 [Rhexocercosporidium sp. MPI-PUGE-AT-0058]|nr:hypothetical protein BKA65DRAFT_178471 [Rhexocercosporidium sp. MPI-PUGE-AT-0058]